MTDCYFCNGTLEETQETIEEAGRSFTVSVKKCSENEDHVFYENKDIEEVRESLRQKEVAESVL